MVKFLVVVVKWQIICKHMNELLLIYITKNACNPWPKKFNLPSIPSIGQKLKSWEFRPIKSYGSKFVDKFPNRFLVFPRSRLIFLIMGTWNAQTILPMCTLKLTQIITMMATNTCLLSCKLCGAKCKPT